jgi:hypothetical protein
MHETPQQPAHEVELAPGAPLHRRRTLAVTAVIVVAAVALVAAAAATVGIVTRPDAAPRELTVEGPATQELIAPADPAGDDAEIERAVRTALDGSLPGSERVAAFEATPSGRPPVDQVIAGFDGLAASSGADLTGAAVAIERPAPDTALARIEVSLTSSFGSRAVLRNLVVRHDGNGWKVDYDSLCALSGLAPILGGTDTCGAMPSLHRSPTVPGLGELLDPRGDAVELNSTLVETYDTSTSVRTGDWTWLVDYPDAEMGGGMPSTPAELVRVHATTGVEDGRVRLPGSNPQLAAADGPLWVLSYPVSDGVSWSPPVLTEIDPDRLTLQDGPPIPADTSSIAASGDVLWTVGASSVLRLRDGAAERTWTAEELGVPPGWVSAVPVATPAGLWLTAHDGTHPVLRLPAGDGGVATGPTDPQLLVSAGDGVWAMSRTAGGPLLRLDADGAIVATIVLPGDDTFHSAWTDGGGGLWLLGSSAIDTGPEPGIIDDAAYTYDLSARPMAVHLGAAGEVIETWWASGVSPTGHSWFGRLGDGLGWAGLDGMQLLVP